MRNEGDYLQRISLVVAGIILAAASAYCASATPEPVALTPTGMTTETPSLTPAAAATETAIPAPTETVTFVPTPSATDTATPDWNATPTRIWPNTPSIIEVTPLGGFVPTPEVGITISDTQAQYLPFALLNVRGRIEGELDYHKWPVAHQLSGLYPVDVFAMLIVYPQQSVWLCQDAPPAPYVDSACALVMAYDVDGKMFGSLIYGE